MESTEVKQAASQTPTAPKRPEFKIPKPKKKRRWVKVLIVLVILAALVFIGMRVPKLKKLHPIVFIGVSALIGILFRM